jgi:ABC-type sugar transport system permease subunit
LAVPALVLFSLFAIVPLALVVALSFTNYTSTTGSFSWIGGANWSRMVSDPLVRQGAKLTLLVMGLSWILQTGLGLLIGVFLAGREHYRQLMSLVFFLPIVLAPVAVAIAWENLLTPYYGGVALTLTHLGVN